MKRVDKEVFVNQTRTWIGTKFHHQGRLKKSDKGLGGCDCVGLLVGVIRELSLEEAICGNIDYVDKRDYKRIVKNSSFEDVVKKYFREKEISSMEFGDIALFRFKEFKYPHHVGIIGKIDNHFSLIHAFIGSESVVEHILDEYWMNNIHSLYEIRF